MNCRYCGSYNPDNAKFCEKCGMKIETIVQEADFGAEAAAEPSKAPRRFTSEDSGTAGRIYEAGASFSGADKSGGYETGYSSYGSAHESDKDAEIPVYEEPEGESPVFEKDPDVIEGAASFVDAKSKESSGGFSYGNYTHQEFSDAERKYYEKRIKDSVSDAARKGLGSQLLLWGSLAVAAQVIFTLIFIFSKKASLAASTVTGLNIGFTPMFYACCVIAVLIELLAVTGFVLNFVYARDKAKPFKTTGLTLIQVFSVIGLIASCFAVIAVCSFGFVMGVSLISFYNMNNVTISMGGLYALVCIALAAFILLGAAIAFFIRVLVSVSRAKKAVFSGTMKKNVSAYAGVIFFIIAAVLLAVAALCAVRALNLSLMFIAAAAMLAVACVLYGLFFFGFRKRMKGVM